MASIDMSSRRCCGRRAEIYPRSAAAGEGFRSPRRVVGPPNKSLVPLRLSSPAVVQSSIEPRLVRIDGGFTTDDDSPAKKARNQRVLKSNQSQSWVAVVVDLCPAAYEQASFH